MQSAHVLNSQSPWAMGLFWISSKVMSNENDRCSTIIPWDRFPLPKFAPLPPNRCTGKAAKGGPAGRVE